MLYHRYDKNVHNLVTDKISPFSGLLRRQWWTSEVGSGVIALPGTKGSPSSCLAHVVSCRDTNGIEQGYNDLCSLHHSLLITNLGLEYTMVIYTSMRPKGNDVAICTLAQHYTLSLWNKER